MGYLSAKDFAQASRGGQHCGTGRISGWGATAQKRLRLHGGDAAWRRAFLRFPQRAGVSKRLPFLLLCELRRADAWEVTAYKFKASAAPCRPFHGFSLDLYRNWLYT